MLGFIRGKWYPQRSVQFAKDRPRLLKWVVLYPARWLDERGVTISAEEYLDLFVSPSDGLLMDALRHGSDSIAYIPAWLGRVIQSHLQIHGDRIYERAKSVARLTEHAIMVAGRQVGAAPDPVRQLAQAEAVLRRNARRLHPARRPAASAGQSDQLSLL